MTAAPVVSPRRPWSRTEVEATVDDYFMMYAAELKRQPYNKTAHRNTLRATLDGRSDRAIEEKHRNISAILAESGLPFIEGYKPRSHYQGLLRDVVLARLDASSQPLIETTVITDDVSVPEDPLTAFVPAPRQTTATAPPATGQGAARRGRDYLILAKENSVLGESGEAFVVHLERRRLTTVNRADLALRVEHVARTVGDGLGYDVLSFQEDGSELHIEVKTTRYGAGTPFFVSSREEAYSRESPETFCLYRVYNWPSPRIYVLAGSLAQHFRLSPSVYKAIR